MVEGKEEEGRVEAVGKEVGCAEEEALGEVSFAYPSGLMDESFPWCLTLKLHCSRACLSCQF